MALQGTRGVIHFGSQICWALAITLLPFATVFALEFTIPAWVALFAVLFLGERMTAHRFFALAICSVGVLVILRPGFEAFRPAALIMLLGALFFAVTAIMTKKLIVTETTFAILFWMNLIQLPLNFLGSDPLFVLKLEPSMILPLIGVTVAGLATHYCLTNAFRYGDAIIVIPMDFVRLPLICADQGWAHEIHRNHDNCITVAERVGEAIMRRQPRNRDADERQYHRRLQIQHEATDRCRGNCIRFIQNRIANVVSVTMSFLVISDRGDREEQRAKQHDERGPSERLEARARITSTPTKQIRGRRTVRRHALAPEQNGKKRVPRQKNKNVFKDRRERQQRYRERPHRICEPKFVILPRPAAPSPGSSQPGKQFAIELPRTQEGSAGLPAQRTDIISNTLRLRERDAQTEIAPSMNANTLPLIQSATEPTLERTEKTRSCRSLHRGHAPPVTVMRRSGPCWLAPEHASLTIRSPRWSQLKVAKGYRPEFHGAWPAHPGGDTRYLGMQRRRRCGSILGATTVSWRAPIRPDGDP